MPGICISCQYVSFDSSSAFLTTDKVLSPTLSVCFVSLVHSIVKNTYSILSVVTLYQAIL